MKKRNILATGGVVTTLLLTGASSSFAQTSRASHAPRQAHSIELEYDSSSRPDMTDFGVGATDELNDMALEDTSRQTLIDEGFSPSQIHKIFSTASASKKHKHFDPEEEY